MFSSLLAQAAPSFWTAAPGSGHLFVMLAVGLIISTLAVILVSFTPAPFRRYVVSAFVFFAGLFYVLLFLWPSPVNRKPGEIPLNFSESVSFFLDSAQPKVADLANTLGAFLIGLGIISVVRIHSQRVLRRHPDAIFSATLLACVVLMVIFGFLDWHVRKFTTLGPTLDLQTHWLPVNYTYNLLFDGLLQQMDAAMFSLIAFYILSAAYRAFRIRSAEAAILLATALIVVLSFMGAFGFFWDHYLVHGDKNWSLGEIYSWIRDSVQAASIRAIDFGVGIGTLSMSLRIWLSLEKEMVGG